MGDIDHAEAIHVHLAHPVTEPVRVAGDQPAAGLAPARAVAVAVSSWAILATTMQRRRPDHDPLDRSAAKARITALLRRTRALGQAARKLPAGEAYGLAEGVLGSLNTTIIQLLELRALLLAGPELALEAARSARQALMVREFFRGDPLRKIGERHGVSGQRVQQLMRAVGACRVPEPPRRCSVCARPVQTRGLCGSHYRRLLKYGDPEFVPRRGVNAEHGTSSRYGAGCRCAACRAANTTRHREIRERRRRALATATVTHGSVSLYRNWGCRCEACHQAMLAQAAVQRAARRARRHTQASR